MVRLLSPSAVGMWALRDHNGLVWFYVPHHDFVPWPEDKITQHARLIAGEHQPARYSRTVRLCGVPVFVIVRLQCRHCRADWACKEGAWALLWLRGVRPTPRPVS